MVYGMTQSMISDTPNFDKRSKPSLRGVWARTKNAPTWFYTAKPDELRKLNEQLGADYEIYGDTP